MRRLFKENVSIFKISGTLHSDTEQRLEARRVRGFASSLLSSRFLYPRPESRISPCFFLFFSYSYSYSYYYCYS